MEATRTIAEFITGLSYDQIPSEVRSVAKAAIRDSVGVALAGSREEASGIAAGIAREESARAEAAVFGHGFRASAMQAAFANGVAAHALDFDASFAIMGQPMAGLASATFAMAETCDASGRALLAAYIAGFEVTGKLARCAPAHAHAGGWHSTGTLGTLGCTVAAAKLLGLDADGVLMALGMAASMASGLVANFGTMSKPLHAGLAARNGVLAARLAQRGFSANAAVFDEGGYFASFARDLPYDPSPLAELDAEWELPDGVRYKAYPCGGLAHTAIDGVLALCREESIAADDIAAIDVKVTAYTAGRIIFGVPETELQGKFSMPYLLARAALDGRLTPDTFSEAAIREPAALALLAKVHMEVDPGLDESLGVSQPSIVRMRLADGRVLERRVDNARGTPAVPMSEAELAEKFADCARRVLNADAAAEAQARLTKLEQVERIAALADLLGGEPTRVAAAR